MRELRELAAKLLADGTVQVVIGWEESRRALRPAFVTRPADAERLEFDSRAVHNLVTYLDPRRAQVKRLGKPAVIVKGCDALAAVALVRESQRRREDFVLIGVRCGGVGQGRCVGCARQEPTFCDFAVGESPAAGTDASEPATTLDADVARIEALPLAERWAFWMGEFERCVRCYACRQACPLCYCERCVAEKTVPQWIEASPHGRGNLAWHLTRALHQAGRCVGCGECERACPAGIPLSLLNRKLEQSAASRFGAVVSDDPKVASAVGTFTLDDPQEFIL